MAPTETTIIKGAQHKISPGAVALRGPAAAGPHRCRGLMSAGWRHYAGWGWGLDPATSAELTQLPLQN